MGTIPQMDKNPAIAVLLEVEQTDDPIDTPIWHAEAQFEDIAMGTSETIFSTKPWYESIPWETTIITAIQKVMLIALLTKYTSVFSTGPTDIGLTHLTKHKINIPNDIIINQRQYPISHVYQLLVAKQMDHLFKAGVIRPSASQFNSPMVIV